MTMFMLAFLAAAALQSAPPPMVANDDRAEGSRLHIGDTGLRCVRLPCPFRALFEPDPQGHAAIDSMLMVDMTGQTPPPPMIGRRSHLSAIRKAWNERRCLAIDGRVIPGEEDRPVLRVDRVIGPCSKG